MDVFGKEIIWDKEEFRLRKTVRAIVLDTNRNVAIIRSDSDDYYKLPGGEILGNEDYVAALSRIIREEINCSADGFKEFGVVTEHKNKYGQIQISNCFICNAFDIKNDKDSYLKKDEKFKICWVPLDEALLLLKKCSPSAYTHQFVLKRDFLFLSKFKELYS
jgi:ADP-ribose pyrophosphatase YjhB (NUDIX family)